MNTDRPQINLKIHNGGVKINPAAFLDGNFNTYLDACKKAGAHYEKDIKSNLAPIEMVPVLIEQLRLSGFDPVLTQDLLDAVREKAAASRDRAEASADVVASVEIELKKRGLELFNFQKSGIRWLSENESGLLADDMGLGKTVQAALAIPKATPAVIISPATLKGNWKNEIRKWRPDLTPTVLAGRGSWKWPDKGEVMICNYDILPEKEERLKDHSKTIAGEIFETGKLCKPGTILIADEAHAVKNSKSKRTKSFRNISKIIREKGGRVWLLTGTPLLNNPMELWNVLCAADLSVKAFGSYPQFVRLFSGYRTEWGMKWGKPSAQVGDLLKKVMLRRHREEVLPDLPTKIWRTIDVELDAKTQNHCNELELKLEEKGFSFGAKTDLAKISQIVFEEISAVRAEIARAKIPKLLELVQTYEDNEQPVVVFSAHLDPIYALSNRDGWAFITGETPVEQREKIVTDFQGGRLKGLGCSIKAGGVGITLTKAHECIFVDLLWTPSLNKQAEDRLCRIGQTRGVIVNTLVANHIIDSRVNDVLREKQMLIEGSVEKAVVTGIESEEKPKELSIPADIKIVAAQKTEPERNVSVKDIFDFL